jgi:hypothetical protein
MAWEGLALEILEDFTSFNNLRHERIAEYLNYRRQRLKEAKQTFKAKLKCDTRRKAHYAAVSKRYEHTRYERLKADPAAFAAWTQMLRAYVAAQPEKSRERHRRYYRRHREAIAAKRNDPATKAARKAYDRARYLRRRGDS